MNKKEMQAVIDSLTKELAAINEIDFTETSEIEVPELDLEINPDAFHGDVLSGYTSHSKISEIQKKRR